MRGENEVREYLNNHWFQDRKHLRRARELLLKRFPHTRDFDLGYYITTDAKIDSVITYDDLKVFIDGE